MRLRTAQFKGPQNCVRNFEVLLPRLLKRYLARNGGGV